MEVELLEMGPAYKGRVKIRRGNGDDEEEQPQEA